jgi:hypothetical protein
MLFPLFLALGVLFGIDYPAGTAGALLAADAASVAALWLVSRATRYARANSCAPRRF